jgi:hypothetical protein
MLNLRGKRIVFSVVMHKEVFEVNFIVNIFYNFNSDSTALRFYCFD